MIKGVENLSTSVHVHAHASDESSLRGLLQAVGHRRVVKADAHLAVVVALVAEGVLDLGLVTGGGAGEDVRAHRNRNLVVALNLVVGEDNRLPALAAVDGEATVLLVATLDGIVADEVRHGLRAGRAERVLGSL